MPAFHTGFLAGKGKHLIEQGLGVLSKKRNGYLRCASNRTFNEIVNIFKEKSHTFCFCYYDTFFRDIKVMGINVAIHA